MPPLVALAIGSAFGAAVYPALQPPAIDTTLATVAALATVALGAHFGARAWPGLLGAGVLLGLLGPASVPDPPLLTGDWRLRGRVATAAWGRSADVNVVAIARSTDAWTPVEGRVRVRFPATPPPPGTAVVVQGTAWAIDPGALPGAPDPTWEASRAGVASELSAREVIRIGAPAPTFSLEGAEHAGLLRAMLDGERSGVEEEVTRVMRRTGTWHLVSISGLHIGLSATAAWGIAWLLTRPLVLLRRQGGLNWVCAAAAIAAAIAYADVAGWPLPARRAVWMSAAGAVLAASRLRPAGAELLALAWLGTTAAEPAAIANAGAQLSFSALIGMMLVIPRVTRLLPLDTPRPLVWLVGGLATTLGATVGTLPTVAWYFQDLSPTAPLANLIAVPLMGTVATPALLASQVLPDPLAGWALFVSDRAIDLALLLIGPLDLAPIHPAVGLFGAVLLGFVILLRRRPLVAAALTAVALGLETRPNGIFQATFFDVGQGDATLLEWHTTRWLVDGGPGGTSLLTALRRMGVRRLDGVVITHPHPDHIGGLTAILGGMEVGVVCAPRAPLPEETDYALLVAGRQLHLGADCPAPATILHPDGFDARGNVNDESLVLRVDAGARRFLFPGDIEEAAEQRLLHADIDVDVLKVPHHGSRTSSTDLFMWATSPSIAVFPVGRANRYGHPHKEVLARYRDVDTYRTDTDGTVTVGTDGDRLWVVRDPPEVWRMRVLR